MQLSKYNVTLPQVTAKSDTPEAARVRMGHRTLWASTSVGTSTLTAYAEKTYAARAYAEPDN
jgi:hypothetical protein